MTWKKQALNKKNKNTSNIRTTRDIFSDNLVQKLITSVLPLNEATAFIKELIKEDINETK